MTNTNRSPTKSTRTQRLQDQRDASELSLAFAKFIEEFELGLRTFSKGVQDLVIEEISDSFVTTFGLDVVGVDIDTAFSTLNHEGYAEALADEVASQRAQTRGMPTPFIDVQRVETLSRLSSQRPSIGLVLAALSTDTRFARTTSDLISSTGLGRTTVKEALQALRINGLIANAEPRSGRPTYVLSFGNGGNGSSMSTSSPASTDRVLSLFVSPSQELSTDDIASVLQVIRPVARQFLTDLVSRGELVEVSEGWFRLPRDFASLLS